MVDFFAELARQPHVSSDFREAVCGPGEVAAEAAPARSDWFDTALYRQLEDQRQAIFFGSCPGPLNPEWKRQRDAHERKTADARWHHEHPGKLGTWRIAIKGVEADDYGTPRFESEAEALVYIAGSPFADYRGIGAVEVWSREAIAMRDAAHRPATIYGEVARAEAQIAAERKAA